MKKIIMKIFLLSIPFGMTMGFLLGALYGINFGIVSGIVFSLFISIFASTFTEFQKRKFERISNEVTNGKKVIMGGGANHCKGKEAVGGWLYLTSDEMIFCLYM